MVEPIQRERDQEGEVSRLRNALSVAAQKIELLAGGAQTYADRLQAVSYASYIREHLLGEVAK